MAQRRFVHDEAEGLDLLSHIAVSEMAHSRFRHEAESLDLLLRGKSVAAEMAQAFRTYWRVHIQEGLDLFLIGVWDGSLHAGVLFVFGV